MQREDRREADGNGDGVSIPPRGVRAKVDARVAERLAWAVGGGEVTPEADDVGRSGSPKNPGLRSIAAVTAGIAALLGLWAGATTMREITGIAAHAETVGGSFGALAAAPGPVVGMPGADGGEPDADAGDRAMRRISSLAVAGAVAQALAATPDAMAQQAVEWKVSEGGNGHWYQLRTDTGRRFWDLVSDASAAGGYLVTIASGAENDFVRSISLGHFVHFGAFHDATAPGYLEPASGWRWVNGETWSWSGWCPGQPDNAPWGGFTGQELARFNGSAVACWDDADSIAQIASIAIEATMFEWSADCNNNGIVDYGEIRAGLLPDTNTNNIPDTCECASNPSLPSCCPGDIYRNGVVDGADLGILLSEWGPVNPSTNSDLDGSGNVNGADLGLLLANWGTCGA